MAQTSQNSAADIAHKPMMSTAQILLMNVGFFGIQYSFGMQQNVMSPIYQFLGASPDELLPLMRSPSSIWPDPSPACSSNRSSGRSRTGPGARSGDAVSPSS